MVDRPILFSAPMVRALLDGRKTQTRRVVKLPHQNPLGVWEAGTMGPGLRTSRGEPFPDQTCISHTRTGDTLLCPYGVPGDTLWVRETWRLHERFSDVERIVYAANKGGSWTEMHEDFPARPEPLKVSAGFRPSIHMPRWASRITLRITGVRVERLNDISEADALAEGLKPAPGGWWSGCDGHASPDPVPAYAGLWEHINGPGAWDANPWVWAVSFERVTP